MPVYSANGAPEGVDEDVIRVWHDIELGVARSSTAPTKRIRNSISRRSERYNDQWV